MITLDGAQGEGGGQILRTALGLSLVTGQAFRLERIRARRPRPGLLRQHLTAVEAAVAVGRARVEGAVLGGASLVFEPGPVQPGHYHFTVGTAGSATLVLQTILPALLLAPGPSSLVIEGGTHNPFAPPYDFLAATFLPLVRRMGPEVKIKLDRPGFYPAGGGKLRVWIEPVSALQPLEVLERGAIRKCRARALLAHLPRHVGERELKVVQRSLAWPRENCVVEECAHAHGPGNVLLLEVESEALTEVFAGFGERGLRAELVAQRAIEEVERYLALNAPVGRYLADQLVVPLALAGGGAFRTLPLTEHTRTNIETVRAFLPARFAVTAEPDGVSRVEVQAPAGAEAREPSRGGAWWRRRGPKESGTAEAPSGCPVRGAVVKLGAAGSWANTDHFGSTRCVGVDFSRWCLCCRWPWPRWKPPSLGRSSG